MPKQILVVDPQAERRAPLIETLREAGYGVTTCDSGDGLVTRAHEGEVDLVMLSAALPGGTSPRTCQELKNDSRTVGTPVVYVSDAGDPAVRVQGLDAGADDVLDVPFEPPEVLARVRSQLRLAKLSQNLEEASRNLARRQRRLDRDIAAAAQIQRALLPRSIPEYPHIEVAWRFLASPLVGGDVFNVLRLDERRLGLYAVDVRGHGVPAAMVTVALSQAMEPRSGLTKRVTVEVDGGRYELGAPLAVVEELRRETRARFGRSFSICYMILDVETGLLRYCNAGHAPPVVVREDGSSLRLDVCGDRDDHEAPLHEASLTLTAGERLFLFSAGVPDLRTPGGEPLGEARLVEWMSLPEPRDVDRVCDDVLRATLAHTGAGKPDHDVVIAGIEFQGVEKAET